MKSAAVSARSRVDGRQKQPKTLADPHSEREQQGDPNDNEPRLATHLDGLL